MGHTNVFPIRGEQGRTKYVRKNRKLLNLFELHILGLPVAAALLAADPLLESPAHALLAVQVQQMFDKAGPMN